MKWDLKDATRAVLDVASMKIFTTEDGRLGLAKPILEHGDIIAIIQGCNLPTILREHEEGYKLIGTCYLDGVMLGEMIKDP